MMKSLSCLCLLISLIPVVAAQSTAELTYLGNEGVLLSDGRTQILIDALFLEDFDTYQLVPKSTQDQIITGHGRFEKIQYFLITHRHADHFNAGLIKRFATHHPETRFISSGQVLDLLANEGVSRDVMIEIETEMNQPFKKVPGLTASILAAWIKHPHQKNYNVVNLTYLIEMNGQRIIHFGDSEWAEGNFARLNLPSFKLNVAMVPTWFLDDPELLSRLIGAKQYIGIHAPKGFKSDSMVLDQPGKTIVLGSRSVK